MNYILERRDYACIGCPTCLLDQGREAVQNAAFCPAFKTNVKARDRERGFRANDQLENFCIGQELGFVPML